MNISFTAVEKKFQYAKNGISAILVHIYQDDKWGINELANMSFSIIFLRGDSLEQ